jgi:tetratricopeptide (TPR) repeat protein
VAFNRGMINRRLFGVMILCAFLGACAGQSKEKAPQSAVTSDAGASTEKIVLVPDPYVLKAKAIPDALNAQFAAASALLQSKRYAEAEAAFSGLAKTYPAVSGPLVNLALALAAQNKTLEAETAFKKAQQVNPLNGDAYIAYGVWLRDQGRFADAQAQYEKAIAVWPHNALAHRNLGILYDLYRGQFDKALYHFEMCRKILGSEDKQLNGWIVELKRRQLSKASNP